MVLFREYVCLYSFILDNIVLLFNVYLLVINRSVMVLEYIYLFYVK